MMLEYVYQMNVLVMKVYWRKIYFHYEHQDRVLDLFIERKKKEDIVSSFKGKNKKKKILPVE